MSEIEKLMMVVIRCNSLVWPTAAKPKSELPILLNTRFGQTYAYVNNRWYPVSRQ